MPELDSKLINYSGLEHFHEMLVNDTISSNATVWSSNKINNIINIPSDALYMLATENNCTVKLNDSTKHPSYGLSIVEYSKDYQTWHTLGTSEVVLNKNEKLYLRGKAANIKDIVPNFLTKTDGFFVTEGNIEMYGDLAYLVNYENLKAAVPYYGLFQYFRNTTITKMPYITSTYFEGESLNSMCRSPYLQQALEFKNEISSKGDILDSMYRGCTSLTKTFPIYIANVYSITGLYWGCTALTEIAPIYINNISYMLSTFRQCTALQKVSLFITNKISIGLNSENNTNNFTSVPTTCEIVTNGLYDLKKLGIYTSDYTETIKDTDYVFNSPDILFTRSNVRETIGVISYGLNTENGTLSNLGWVPVSNLDLSNLSVFLIQKGAAYISLSGIVDGTSSDVVMINIDNVEIYYDSSDNAVKRIEFTIPYFTGLYNTISAKWQMSRNSTSDSWVVSVKQYTK